MNPSPIQPLTWSLKILLIDDVDTNRALLGQMLTHLGQEVIAVSSGEEALAIGREQLFDLVLMDMIMPGLSGQQTVQLWRTDGTILDPDCPVFVLSATVSQDQILSPLIEQGFDAQINKPTTLQTLNRALEKAAQIQLQRNKTLKVHDRQTDTPIVDISQAELMERLSTHLLALIGEAKRSIIYDDWHALGNALHTIKGSAGVGGLSEIAQEAAALEKKLENEQQLTMVEIASLYRMIIDC